MNLNTWTEGSAITLPQVLDARENRVAMQQELLKKNPASLISFTLNIAGPVKVFPLTTLLYKTGLSLIKNTVLSLNGTLYEIKEIHENTGYEAFLTASLPPLDIKKALTYIEENHALGRLFDFDVLDSHGEKISRQEIGFGERTCLLCQNPAFICGRSRAHSAQELIGKTINMTQHFYQERMASHIGLLMQKALFYEVNTTLKPGLVDRVHNGSHTDMCLDTFIKSAYALTPYFIQCAHAGLSFSQPPQYLPELFQSLRTLGKHAEETMLQATSGVNTHKGMVFSGGILCSAAGYAAGWYMLEPSSAEFTKQISKVCRQMLPELMNDYKAAACSQSATHGKKLYDAYGITGIRGEASMGFPHVLDHGLPLLEHLVHKGYSLYQSGLLTLLYYIAHIEDTNLIIRSDYHTAKKIQRELSAFLETADYECQLQILPELDNFFVSQNISPGGSADMLALTYFLYFLKERPCCFD